MSPVETIAVIIAARDLLLALPDHEHDEYGSVVQLAAIYEYAISNYNEPGIRHLLEAIAFSEGPPGTLCFGAGPRGRKRSQRLAHELNQF